MRSLPVKHGIGDLKNSYYKVEVYIPIAEYYMRSIEHEEELDELAKECGGRMGDTGAGFGRRDWDFLFRTQLEAHAFVDAILTDLFPQVRVDRVMWWGDWREELPATVIIDRQPKRQPKRLRN